MDENIPRGLEDTVVIPGRIRLLKLPCDAIVLSQEEHVHHGVARSHVPAFRSHREQPLELIGIEGMFLGDEQRQFFEARKLPAVAIAMKHRPFFFLPVPGPPFNNWLLSKPPCPRAEYFRVPLDSARTDCTGRFRGSRCSSEAVAPSASASLSVRSRPSVNHCAKCANSTVDLSENRVPVLFLLQHSSEHLLSGG